MKDERFVKTGEDAYRLLNLQQFPNFHESGNIEGMRNRYYGKDAYLVHAGHYIYHVDEDTFRAVKDFNTLELQPEWLMKWVKDLTKDDIEEYRRTNTTPKQTQMMEERDKSIRESLDWHGFQGQSQAEVEKLAGIEPIKGNKDMFNAKMAMASIHNITELFNEKLLNCQHEQVVMELAAKGDMLQALKDRIQKGITDAKLVDYNAQTEIYSISCKIDGVEQPKFQVSENHSRSLDNIPESLLNERLKELSTLYLADKLFEPLKTEQQKELNIPVMNAMNDEQMKALAEKVNTVLMKFYSIHEADDLTRIITDQEKDMEDVKAMMNVIDYRNRLESEPMHISERITQAEFVFSEKNTVFLRAEIDGYRMHPKQLTDWDAADIMKMDRSLLTEEELEDMAKDMAMTYFDKETKMSHEQLATLAVEQDVKLTPQDARTYDDLEMALKEKFPEGLTLQMAGLKTDDLWGYILYNHLRDDDITLEGVGRKAIPSDDYLQAEVRLPKEALRHLTASPDVYYEQDYAEFLESLENGEVYDAATMELMHRCPDLDDARFILPEKQLVKYLYIEGQPMDKAVSWMLQNPELREARLKEVMTYEGEARKELWAETARHNREEKMDRPMPENLYMIRNPEHIWFRVPGVLGHAKVDRMRGVTYSGETMPREIQDYINDFVSNRNVESVRPKRAFFIEPGHDSEQHIYLDDMKNKLVRIDHQKDMDGKDMYTDGVSIVSKVDMAHLQDITGRVTDAVIIGIDKPMVRCKIDGEQQMAQKLTRAEIIRMGGIPYNSEEMKRFALSTAVSHFATSLYRDNEQEQTKGMRR